MHYYILIYYYLLKYWYIILHARCSISRESNWHLESLGSNPDWAREMFLRYGEKIMTEMYNFK